MLKSRTLTPADRVALIAAAGLAASAGVWVVYALVENAMLGGQDFGTALAAPDPSNALSRLLAIVGILSATLLIQIVYTKRVDVERALQLEKTRVREMYENSPDRIVCLGEDGEVLYTNLPQGADDACDARSALPCYRLLYSRNEACEGCALEQVVRDGAVTEFIEPEAAGDGSLRWFSKMLYPIRGEDGTTDSVVEIARDVTSLHVAEAALRDSHQQLEAKVAARTAELTKSNLDLVAQITARERMSVALRESEARIRDLIDGSPDMIILHSEGRVDLVNPAGVRMLGASDSQDVVGMSFAELWDDSATLAWPGDVRTGRNRSASSTFRELGLRRLDGTHVDVEMSETLVLLEGRIHGQCVIRDVTDAVQAREIINRLAFFDALTGLPNKSLFADRVQAALAAVRRNRLSLAVAFVDIHEFRKVNDSWGHAAGDSLLTQFAERLQSLFRESDTVSRYGSDEFAILAELGSPDEAAGFGARVRDGLAAPFRVAGEPISLSVSLGIAVTSGRRVRAEEIIRRADEALCRSKQSSGSLEITPFEAEVAEVIPVVSVDEPARAEA